MTQINFDLIGNSAIPVFAFYLLVFCNFTAEVLGCRLQQLLRENMFFKHIISYILLLFLVVLVNPDAAANEFYFVVLFTFAIYILFILTTHSPLYIMFIILVLLLTAYVINTIKAKYKDDRSKAYTYHRLQLTQNILASVAFGLSIIGFIIYTLEKRAEYGSEFSWIKYITGAPVCKRYTPTSAKLI